MPMDLRIAGAVLAGGMARRLGGADKGLLERVPGQLIIEHELHELLGANIADVIVVSNRAEAYRALGRRVVPDLRPGLGPMAGIEAALDHFATRADAVLVLPCDMPAIAATEMAALLDVFRGRPAAVHMVVAGERGFYRHPCCCVVPCSVLPAVRRSLDQGKLKLGLLWRDLGAVEVHFPDPAPFHNVNTPDDLAAWADRQRRPPS